jgi:hypothetical protein
VKYTAENLTPNSSLKLRFPPLPNPLLRGEGKGIMFLAGRGVRIKASLLEGERFSREVRLYLIQSRRAIDNLLSNSGAGGTPTPQEKITPVGWASCPS